MKINLTFIIRIHMHYFNQNYLTVFWIQKCCKQSIKWVEMLWNCYWTVEYLTPITDETSPRAECPLDQIVNANHDNNTKAVVKWQLAPCSDNSNETILLDCSHQSEHKFGLGNTTVQCNCTDASGNTGQCSFHVMVKG